MNLNFKLFLALIGLYLIDANDNWNNLKVTWGINPFGSNNFVALPRQASEAIKQGWVKEKDCSTVNGNRYILNGDRSVMLIFNNAGNIAGVASAVPKNLPFNFPSANIQKFFNDEGDFWSITAYFSDPSTVCAKSAPKQSTGDRLVFVSSLQSVNIPLKESDMSSFWTLGQCFWTMGVHYWANVNGKVNADMNADDFVPIFLQYNKGQLNGFGWAFNANFTSTRFEHPTQSVLPQFFKEVPKFFSDPTKAGVLSTMHIYLDSTPQLNFC